MSKTRAISARIQETILWKIDQENMVACSNRNRVLNNGAAMWCYTQDVRRELKIHDRPDVRKKILRGYLRLFVPEAVDLIND